MLFDLFGDTRKEYADISYKLSVINKTLNTLLERTNKMALDLTALTDEVARLETVDASAITLLQALLAAVEANKNDPVALQALVDRIKAADDSLAAAVAANTPAAPV